MAGGDEAGGASNGGKGNGWKRTVKKDTIGIGRDVTEDGGVSYGQKTKIPSPSGRAAPWNETYRFFTGVLINLVESSIPHPVGALFEQAIITWTLKTWKADWNN